MTQSTPDLDNLLSTETDTPTAKFEPHFPILKTAAGCLAKR